MFNLLIYRIMVINYDDCEKAINEVWNFDDMKKIIANPSYFLDLTMSLLRFYQNNNTKNVLVLYLVYRLAAGALVIEEDSNNFDSKTNASYAKRMLNDVRRFLFNYKDFFPTKEECDQFDNEQGNRGVLDFYETQEIMCVWLARLYYGAGLNFVFDKSNPLEPVAEKLCLHYYEIAIDIHKKGLINLSNMIDRDYSNYDKLKERLNFNWGVPEEEEVKKPAFHSEYRNGKYIVINDDEPSTSSNKLTAILFGVAVVVIVIFLILLF